MILINLCPTCKETMVRRASEECRACYTKDLKAYAEMKLCRDVEFTPQWSNEDFGLNNVY